MKLFCLPFAGAGATVYRAWPSPADDSLHVVPLQLAGREERFAEPFYADIESAGLDQVRAIQAALAPDEPFALFGHSFGATLAFEVAHQLARLDDRRLVHLFVSGAPAPHVPLGRDSLPLDDDAFVASVEKIAGYTHPALADPDLRELVLPVLRADVVLHEGYRARERHPLDVPLTALRGQADHVVSEEDCRSWTRWSQRPLRSIELPGGHMYLVDDPARLLREIAVVLDTAQAEELTP